MTESPTRCSTEEWGREIGVELERIFSVVDTDIPFCVPKKDYVMYPSDFECECEVCDHSHTTNV